MSRSIITDLLAALRKPPEPRCLQCGKPIGERPPADRDDPYCDDCLGAAAARYHPVHAHERRPPEER